VVDNLIFSFIYKYFLMFFETILVYEKNTREISLLHPELSGARRTPQALYQLRHNMDTMEKKAGPQTFSPRQKAFKKDFCRETTTESSGASAIETNLTKRDEQEIGNSNG
jgi:hypothetical protein